MVVAIAAVLVAQTADLLTFSQVVAVMGKDFEQNPLARFIYEQAGLAGVIGFKVLILSVIFALIHRLPQDDWQGGWRIFLLVVLIVIGLIGAGSNMLALHTYLMSQPS
jgi:hypothetical protein